MPCPLSVSLKSVQSSFSTSSGKTGNSRGSVSKDCHSSYYTKASCLSQVSEKSCEEKENEESKIVWNGADVTPLPLWGDDFNLDHVCTSWLSSTDEDIPAEAPYEEFDQYNTFDTYLRPNKMKITGSTIPNDNPEYMRIKNENEKTGEVKLQCEVQDSAAQTFHLPLLDKQTESLNFDLKHSGTSSIETEMWLEKERSNSTKRNLKELLFEAVLSSEGFLLDVSEGEKPVSLSRKKFQFESLEDYLVLRERNRLERSRTCLKRLELLERASLQNNNCLFLDQLKYFGIPRAEDEQSDQDSTSYSRLSSNFTCSATKGRSINCMQWHATNSDLLIVGYSSTSNAESSLKDNGLIAFWSIRNPYQPEIMIVTEFSVTAIASSSSNPFIIAVGFKNGKVALIDSSKATNFVSTSLTLSATGSSKCHCDYVSEIFWIANDTSKGTENLISLSHDGTLLQWSTQNGLQVIESTILKRQDDVASVFQNCGGRCFDLSNDLSYYAVGTDEGRIVFGTFSWPIKMEGALIVNGHDRPVNKLKFSPFNAHIILSCSNGWDIKLWSVVKEKLVQVTTFNVGLSESVNDIAWSLHNSTLFSSVTRDGRLDWWDLDISTHDPVHSDKATMSGSRLRNVLFSNNAPIMVTGSNEGQVDIYHIAHAERMSGHPSEQKEKQMNKYESGSIASH